MSLKDLTKFLQKDILEGVVKRDINDFRAVLNKHANLIYITPQTLVQNTGFNIAKTTEIFRQIRKNLNKAGLPPLKEAQGKKGHPIGYLRGRNSIVLVGSDFRNVSKHFSAAVKQPNVLSLLLPEERRKKGGEGADAGEERNPFDVGHVGGFGSEAKNTPLSLEFTEAKDALYAKAAQLQDKYSAGYLKEIGDGFDTYLQQVKDAHLEFSIISRKELNVLKAVKNLGTVSFVFTMPQMAKVNNALAVTEKKIADDAAKYLQDNIDVLPSSKTFFQMIHDAVVNIFQDNKKKPYVPYKADTRVAKKVDVSPKRQKVAKAKLTPVRNAQGQFASLINLTAMMNARLHDQIKANMGKGKSKQILNYRTGRFAKSAEITVLQRRKDKIVALYDYMSDPYDVFLPGRSHLAKPGRDPRRIISKSIRQLAKTMVSAKFKVSPMFTRGG